MNELIKEKIEIEQRDFPEKILKIKDVPKKLYAIGNKKLLFEDSFAVVGTRKISDYGKKNCESFSKEFVLRDIPIVSGMALGTDTVAHETAIKNNGKTIAVLGSGFNYIFPKENENLFYQIINSDGLIITEYEDNVMPLKNNFPKRNRIVTAISEGVLVIEAAYRSGTSITARNANEQGKLVFALPGMLNSSVGIGVNKLIQKGAILTTNIEDIINNYPNFKTRKRRDEIYKKVIKTVESRKIKDLKISEKYHEIIRMLLDESKYLDEIIEKFGTEVIEDISILEFEGIIKLKDDGKYEFIK